MSGTIPPTQYVQLKNDYLTELLLERGWQSDEMIRRHVLPEISSDLGKPMSMESFKKWRKPDGRLRRSNAEKLCALLRGNPKLLIIETSDHGVSEAPDGRVPTEPKPLVYLPHPRQRLFCGRDVELGKIADYFANGHKYVGLHAPPGYGKTQLANEYSHRYQHTFDLIWWLDASSEATWTAGLGALVHVLSGEKSSELPPAVLAVTCQRLLASQRRPLLVVDNATDPRLIRETLAVGSQVAVLATSTSYDIANAGVAISVPQLDRDSVRYIMSAVVGATNDTEVDDVLARVGAVPAILLSVAAACRVMQTRASNLLQGRPSSKIFTSYRPSDYDSDLVRAWIKILSRIHDDRVRRSIACIAFVAPSGAIATLLVDDDSDVPELLAEISRLGDTVSVTRDDYTYFVYMHQVTQTMVRTGLPAATQFEIVELLCRRIHSSVFRKHPPAPRDVVEPLASHAMTLYRHCESLGRSSIDVGKALVVWAWCRKLYYAFDECLEILSVARRHIPDDESLDNAFYLLALCRVLKELGRYDEAKVAGNRTVELETGTTQRRAEAHNALGSCHLHSGDYISAERCFRVALEMALEAGDFKIAGIFSSNVAEADWRMGRLDDALTAIEFSLRSDVARLASAQHIVSRLTMLAQILVSMGHFSRARIVFQDLSVKAWKLEKNSMRLVDYVAALARFCVASGQVTQEFFDQLEAVEKAIERLPHIKATRRYLILADLVAQVRLLGGTRPPM